MAKSPFTAALILAAGVAGGYLLAELGEEAAPSAAPAAEAPLRGEAPRRGETPRGDRQVALVAGGLPERASSAAPAGALQTLSDILRLESDFAQTAALYRLIDDAGIEDLQRLVAEANNVPGVSDRRAALSILFARYADLDPAAALDFLRAHGGSYGDVELRAIFHAWSRSDLEGAVAAAEGLPFPMRHGAGMAILHARDDLTTRALEDVAQRLGVPEMVSQVTLSRTMDAAQRDPYGAWQAALSNAGGPHRQQRLVGIVHAWARQDPLSAMNAVGALGNARLRAMLQAQVLDQWGRQSPQEAVDWALAQPPSPQRAQLASAALGSMAEADPQLAFDMARGLEGQEQVQAVRRVLMEWASVDAAAAGRAVDTLSGGGLRRDAINQVASAYVQQDADAALQWVSGLQEQEAAQATALMFSMLASRDPATASNLTHRLTDASSRAQAAGNVAQAWVQQDPRAAVQWVDSLTDEDVRSVATANLVGSWSRFDRDAAVRYAEGIPADMERESALVSIIAMQHDDPQYAEQLFERLTLAEQRAHAARTLYHQLLQSDPQRAARYREMAGPNVRRSVTR